jgi:leader peptidase (prepilin peptidase) / N-methyltransferase
MEARAVRAVTTAGGGLSAAGSTVHDDVEVTAAAAIMNRFALDPRGLWAAAGVHAKAFRRPRLLSLLALATASRRMDAQHAVATLLVVGKWWSMVSWSVAAVLALAAVPVSVALGVVSPAWFALFVAVAAICFVAGTASIRRVQACWCWRGARGALLVADVAASPPEQGFGGRLMRTMVADADRAGRLLVLRVEASNLRALQLYRDTGFTRGGVPSGRWVHMVRTPAGAPAAAVVPRVWSSPLSGLALTTAFSITAVLVAAYWGTPVAWLTPVTATVATAAAWFDLRVQRVPNRLNAFGAIASLALVVFVDVVFGVKIVVPAVAGAAILAAPLLVAHVVTRDHTPGLGDVKLAAVLGVIAGAVDPAAALVALVTALLVGAVFGLVWRATGRGHAFPFAPSLAAAAVGVLIAWPLLGGSTTW